MGARKQRVWEKPNLVFDLKNELTGHKGRMDDRHLDVDLLSQLEGLLEWDEMWSLNLVQLSLETRLWLGGGTSVQLPFTFCCNLSEKAHLQEEVVVAALSHGNNCGGEGSNRKCLKMPVLALESDL